MMTPDEQNQLRKSLGLYITWGLGGAYPALKNIIGKIAGDKVAQWPWVPHTWLSGFRDLQTANANDLVRIAPARVVIPEFCDTVEKVALWNELAGMTEAAVNKYANGQTEEGRVELEAAYANVDFWNKGFGATLIKTAETIRDLPKNAAGAILDGAGEVAGGLLKRIFSSWITWVVVFGLVGFIAWRSGLVKMPKAKE